MKDENLPSDFVESNKNESEDSDPNQQIDIHIEKELRKNIKYFKNNYKSYYTDFVSNNSIGTTFFIKSIDAMIYLMNVYSKKILPILLTKNPEFEIQLNKKISNLLENLNKNNISEYEIFIEKWSERHPQCLIDGFSKKFLKIYIKILDCTGSFLLKPLYFLKAHIFNYFVLKLLENDTFIEAVERMTVSKDPSFLLRFMRDIMYVIKTTSVIIYNKMINSMAKYGDVLIFICLNTKNYILKKNFVDIFICFATSEIFKNFIHKAFVSGDFFSGCDYKQIPAVHTIDSDPTKSELDLKELRLKNFFPELISEPKKLSFHLYFLTKIMDIEDERLIYEMYKRLNVILFLFFESNCSGIEKPCYQILKILIEKRIYSDIVPNLYNSCLHYGKMHLTEIYSPFPFIEAKYSYIISLIRTMLIEGYEFESNEMMVFWVKEINKMEISLECKGEVFYILEDLYNDSIMRYIFHNSVTEIPDCNFFTEFEEPDD